MFVDQRQMTPSPTFDLSNTALNSQSSSYCRRRNSISYIRPNAAHTPTTSVVLCNGESRAKRRLSSMSRRRRPRYISEGMAKLCCDCPIDRNHVQQQASSSPLDIFSSLAAFKFGGKKVENPPPKFPEIDEDEFAGHSSASSARELINTRRTLPVGLVKKREDNAESGQSASEDSCVCSSATSTLSSRSSTKESDDHKKIPPIRSQSEELKKRVSTTPRKHSGNKHAYNGRLQTTIVSGDMNSDMRQQQVSREEEEREGVENGRLIDGNVMMHHTESRQGLGMMCRGNSFRDSNTKVSPVQKLCVAILFFVNLINYMDRLTIAGILPQVQSDFSIGDAEAGSLQTAFVLSYMVFAPLFGFLGDRYPRKLIMATGVFFWTLFTLIGSFMESYTSFLWCRVMVGIGEASYSTIAPTIISDYFIKEMRSKMLAVFYFAIPLGSGLGYVVGSETSRLMDGDWRWGLRVTPVLGIIATILILVALVEPKRGEAENCTSGGEYGNEEGMCNKKRKSSSYSSDLKYLCCENVTFILSTLSFTCVAFCTGALSWWGPKFLGMATKFHKNKAPSSSSFFNVDNVSLIFGGVTMLSGVIGVPLGSFLSMFFAKRSRRADPIICGIGMGLSCVSLVLALYTAQHNMWVAFILILIGEVTLNLNWSIVADILLYVVVPHRRSTAEAVQILISHALGDAGSPYLIGLISDGLRKSRGGNANTSFVQEETGHDSSKEYSNTSNLLVYDNSIDDSMIHKVTETPESIHIPFNCLREALLLNTGVQVLGVILFFMTSCFVVRDRVRCSLASLDSQGSDRKDHQSSSIASDVSGDSGRLTDDEIGRGDVASPAMMTTAPNQSCHQIVMFENNDEGVGGTGVRCARKHSILNRPKGGQFSSSNDLINDLPSSKIHFRQSLFSLRKIWRHYFRRPLHTRGSTTTTDLTCTSPNEEAERHPLTNIPAPWRGGEESNESTGTIVGNQLKGPGRGCDGGQDKVTNGRAKQWNSGSPCCASTINGGALHTTVDNVLGLKET